MTQTELINSAGKFRIQVRTRGFVTMNPGETRDALIRKLDATGAFSLKACLEMAVKSESFEEERGVVILSLDEVQSIQRVIGGI